jgi:hypothetical protein
MILKQKYLIKLEQFFTRDHLLALRVSIVFYILFITTLFVANGFTTYNESEKYINYATEFYQGDFSALKLKIAFLSHILFVLVTYILPGKNVIFPLLVLLVLNIIAAKQLFSLVLSLTKSYTIALASLIPFLFSYQLQQWTLSLYSEALLLPISVIVINILYHLKDNKGWFLVLLLIFLALVRPQGVMLAMPFFALLMVHFFRLNQNYISPIFYILLLMVFSIIFLIPNHCEDVVRPIAELTVLYGYKQAYHLPEVLPFKCSIFEAYKFSINQYGIFEVLLFNIKKAVYFFNFNRPFYSSVHNLLMLPYYLLYPLAVVGYWFNRKQCLINVLGKAFFAMILLVFIMFNEWHGRFFLINQVILIIFAALGIGYFTDKFQLGLKSKVV